MRTDVDGITKTLVGVLWVMPLWSSCQHYNSMVQFLETLTSWPQNLGALAYVKCLYPHIWMLILSPHLTKNTSLRMCFLRSRPILVLHSWPVFFSCSGHLQHPFGLLHESESNVSRCKPTFTHWQTLEAGGGAVSIWESMFVSTAWHLLLVPLRTSFTNHHIWMSYDFIAYTSIFSIFS